MARKPPQNNSIGDSMRVHWPGAYVQVVDEVCSEQALDAGRYLSSSGDTISALDYELAEAERKAELIRQRSGQAVRCHSHHLPAGLDAPFEKFPRDGQRQFLVFPSDEIVLQPRQSRSA